MPVRQLQQDERPEAQVRRARRGGRHQTIRGRTSLVGFDVIHLHRLLKNPVEVPEYLLVSDELFRAGGSAAAELTTHEIPLELEGIGEVQTHYVDVGDLAVPIPDPSWPRRIGATLAMAGRGLPYAVGLQRRRPVRAAG